MAYSVLLTVYKNDNPEYLRLSIESMLNQTIPSNDIVVVKDGPVTDEIQAVLDELSNKNPIIQQIQLEKMLALDLPLMKGSKRVKTNWLPEWMLMIFHCRIDAKNNWLCSRLILNWILSAAKLSSSQEQQTISSENGKFL